MQSCRINATLPVAPFCVAFECTDPKGEHCWILGDVFSTFMNHICLDTFLCAKMLHLSVAESINDAAFGSIVKV